MTKRLYLRLGDKVYHSRYRAWGVGEVVEEMTSALAGGGCYVRVAFGDGAERRFINDLDNSGCCYYTGIKLMMDKR